uniref:Phosphatidylinositol transfer protein N-terminal domain-containing protein n=1 Tax=Spongospora subterranea TaxID=70186 RepID=A0A0H5QPU7_9EUKA|eukprot:CRZ03637.1 hypothetical protein [Spongospora subterranea]
MKITELVVGAPCTIDQGLSAYFYSFHRFVGELNSVDMRIVQSQTDSDSNVIVQRKYSLSKTFFPIWAQALASSGLDAVETCSANVKNRSIISGFECPAFGNRLFVDVVTRFATAPNISNMFNLNSKELSIRKVNRTDLCDKPTVYIYKLIKITFRHFALQNRLETYIETEISKTWLELFRHAIDWKSEWANLSLEDVIRNTTQLNRVHKPHLAPGQIKSRL